MRRMLLRSWLWKPSVRDEVDGEFAFHLDMRTREYIARGLSPEDARRAALSKFGDVRLANETCRRLGRERDRQMRRREYLGELRQDIVFGWRQLWKNPGFACVALLTLALGIGATTAIFSAVHAVVLRPVAVADPDRLVYLFETGPQFNRANVSRGNFVEWSRRSSIFDGTAAAVYSSFNVTEGDTPERVVGARVTGKYFSILGVAPVLGRTFGDEEAEPGRDGVIVLSHRLWIRRFAGDASIVGRDIRINGEKRMVLGVMPASFDLTASSEELWVPFPMTAEDKANFDNHILTIIARLKPGVTIDQARAHLDPIALQLQKEQPLMNSERSATAVPFMEIFVGDYRQRLFVLLGAVGLVLLIACGNVANLLLARGNVRASEVAVRAALGAGRGRLVRQLLTESALLALLGAILGVGFAGFALRMLIRMSPPGVPRLDQAHLDPATLIFAVSIALISSLVFGIVPAWRATRFGAAEAMRGGRSGGMGTSRDRVRSVLVAVEVALALLLLVGAGLLIRTALALDAVDPGFEPRGVLSARVALPRAEYLDDARVRQTLERLVDETRALTGVTHAAVVSQVPLGSGGNGNGLIPEGREISPKSVIISRLRLVTPGYFETMRIPIKAGRALTDQDRRGVQKVMIVSEALARQAFPNESTLDGVIGKRISCCEPGPGGGITSPDWKYIVGVAADVRSQGLAATPSPEFYLPIAQAPSTPPGAAWDWVQRTMYLVARTPGDPVALTPGMTGVLRAIDPAVPLFNIRTMEERLAGSRATSRFNTVLLTTLGVMGLVLAAIGIYGVIAYFVSQRTQEIGVRLALGAAPTDVIRLVIRQALKPVIVGLVLGVAGAIAASNLLAAQLYGVSPRDPVTIAAVSLGFILIAIVASWAPARRAARVDPTRALNTA